MNSPRRLAMGLVLLGACSPGASLLGAPGLPTRVLPLQALTEIPPAVSTPSTRVIRAWKTLAGSKVLFVEAHGLPLVDLAVSFAAGSRHDGDQPGLAAMTLSLLNEGSRDKDFDSITQTFDSLGVTLGNGVDRDHAFFSLRSLSDPAIHMPALQLLAEMLGQPGFRADAMARVRNELLDGQLRHDPVAETWISHRAAPKLYSRHPYAVPVYGDEQSVARIGTEQLRAFHRRAYSAGNAIILLVGDLSLAQAQRISVAISEALPAGPGLAPIARAEPGASQLGSSHIERAALQVQLDFAQIAPTRDEPDYLALSLASLIFGDGYDSRLMRELREHHGITYSVSAQLATWQARGPFHINLSTAPQYRDAVIQRVTQMFHQFLSEGPTHSELLGIKQSLWGSMALASASNADILQALLEIARHDLPLDLTHAAGQAQQLSQAAIKRALNRHLRADGWVITSIGPRVAQQALPEYAGALLNCQPGPAP